MKMSDPPILSAEPDIIHFRLDIQAKHRYLVMASDGVWSRMTNRQVARFVKQSDNGSAEYSLAHLLVDEAFRKGSFDNISAIVVRFG